MIDAFILRFDKLLELVFYGGVEGGGDEVCLKGC